MFIVRLSAVLLAGALTALPAQAAPSDDEAIAAQKPTYPLTTCLVSGEPLGGMGEPVSLIREGHLVQLCCKGCVKELDKTPQKYLKAVEDAVVEAQAASYPLETCVVSGEALEGKPTYVVEGTRLVALCCNGCKKEFAKDPAKALAKVDEALIERQTADYPVDTCLVDDKPLGDKPVRQLYGLALTQFCSQQCAARFKAEPPGFMKKLEVARGGGKGRAEKPASGRGEPDRKGGRDG
jgi:YHS domain-containing protein